MAFCLGSLLPFLSYFQHVFRFPTFRPERHRRDIIGGNVHLVHHNWYRISFMFFFVWIWLFQYTCVLPFEPCFADRPLTSLGMNKINLPQTQTQLYFAYLTNTHTKCSKEDNQHHRADKATWCYRKGFFYALQINCIMINNFQHGPTKNDIFCGISLLKIWIAEVH
jgi:hypothetical protein